MFFYASESGRGTVGLDPYARLTVKAGRLFLHRWDPRLAVRGKEHAFYESVFERGIVLADLYRDWNFAGPELFVRPLPKHRLDEDGRRLISSWAEACGVSRVWFGDEACIDLRGHPSFGAVQSTFCPVCGWQMEESSLEVWRWTERNQRTTSQCQVCGCSSMPQALFTPAGASS